MPINHFNIRIYGIILNETKDSILISDEFQLGMRMTKFPGGGMHFGEGPIDCLKREAIEEFGQEIEIERHFYTTDFFQKALFYEDHQLISIYFIAKFIEKPRFKITLYAFNFENAKEGSQSFRWVKISEITTEMFTFPIDKVVSEMIREKSVDYD